jgi:hypothetical protein
MTTLTIEALLEQAYDLEQQGHLAEAARLRAMAHDHQAAQIADEQPAKVLLAAARWLDTHTPGDLPAAAIAAVQREMADPTHRNRPPVQIGRTVENIPILGEFDVDGEPYGVALETDHWRLDADEDGHLTLSCDADGALIELDASLGAYAVLRDFAGLIAGTTPERLVALARQWDALRPPRPPTPPKPAASPAEQPPTPAYVLDRTSFPARIGALMAKLHFALDDELERSEAEPIMAWLESLSDAELARSLSSCLLGPRCPPRPACAPS